MKVIIKNFCLFMCLIFSVVDHADCKLDTQFIRAEYLITTIDKYSRKSQYRLNLLRNNKQVAHRYPEKGFTNVWNLSAKNKIKFTRYFDHQRRAIEYEAKTDTRELTQWKKIYYLFPHDLLEKQSAENLSCEAESEFSNNYQGVEFVGDYLVNAVLPKKLTVTYTDYTEKWSLVKISYAKSKTQKVFNDLSAYKSTDYADIGDNEDDPFLRQMINLGFTKNVGSLFHGEQGNSHLGAHKH